MPLIDMAVSVKGTAYKSAPFTDCLTTLGWTEGDGMMNAITFFTAMNNNACYCPTLTINEAGRLEMVWGDDASFALILSLGDTLDDIRYQLIEEGKAQSVIEVTFEHAQTLVEFWAAVLSQGNPVDESPKGKAKKPQL